MDDAPTPATVIGASPIAYSSVVTRKPDAVCTSGDRSLASCIAAPWRVLPAAAQPASALNPDATESLDPSVRNRALVCPPACI